ncbi:hypothetical protein TNCV_4929581 [Trichonephila clavipes]|nr:hypothetical protein TNCV_4929581 [Trichonephila clavipes]
MDVCKCIVPSWHEGTVNSRQAASLTMRLVGDPDHIQGVLPQNWGGNEQNRTVTCTVLKAKEIMLGFSTRTLEDANLEYIKAAGRLPSYYKEGYGYVQLFHDLARSAFIERKKAYLSKSKTDNKPKRQALIDVLLKLHFESQDFDENEAVKEIVTFIVALAPSWRRIWRLNFYIAKFGDMSPNVGDKLGDHGNPAPNNPVWQPYRGIVTLCIELFSYLPDFARSFYFSIILASARGF